VNVSCRLFKKLAAEQKKTTRTRDEEADGQEGLSDANQSDWDPEELG
jgi:hypothetical protein